MAVRTFSAIVGVAVLAGVTLRPLRLCVRFLLQSSRRGTEGAEKTGSGSRKPPPLSGGDAGALAEESGATVDDAALLVFGQLRINWQRQHAAARVLAGREIALAVAEILQAF